MRLRGSRSWTTHTAQRGEGTDAGKVGSASNSTPTKRKRALFTARSHATDGGDRAAASPAAAAARASSVSSVAPGGTLQLPASRKGPSLGGSFGGALQFAA